MQNYDIRYDDKYGQLAQIDVAAEGAGYEPWVNQTLTSVNDSVVRLAVIEGELVDWHSHEHEDEFFLVLEGKLELEMEGREPFVLGVHQGVTIPRGVLHHPRAHGRTVLLMVEPAEVGEGVRGGEMCDAASRSNLVDADAARPSTASWFSESAALSAS